MRILIPPATFRGISIPEYNMRENLWHKKQILIGFNGTEQEQNLVKTLAQSWFDSKKSDVKESSDVRDESSHVKDESSDVKDEGLDKKIENKETKVQVGIELEWVTDLLHVRRADIRIVFNKTNISYTRLGSDAMYVPKDCHTMQIGKDYTNADILFLFGTAMGLMRSRPRLKLKEYQIREDIRQYGFSDAEIIKFVIDDWFSSYQNSIEEDPESIMHHWISPQWTEDNFVNAHVTTPSEKDLKWFQHLYQKH